MPSLSTDYRPANAAGAATTRGTFFTLPQPHQPAAAALADVPAEVQEAGWKFLKPIIDEYAFGWNAPDGGRPQWSRERLNEHFEAVLAKQFGLGSSARFIPALSKARVLATNRGAEMIRVRSHHDSPYMLIRIDLDRHHPHQRDLQQTQVWADALFGGKPYWEAANDRGQSGYLLIQRDARSQRQMNKLRSDLHVAIKALARAAGLRTYVEAMGGYLETSQRLDSHGMPQDARRVVGSMDGAFMANLPHWRTMADVEALRGAVIPAGSPLLARIIKDGLAAEAAYQKKMERQERLLAAIRSGDDEDDETAPCRSSSKGKRLAPSADAGKPQQAWWTVQQAQYRMGIRTRDELTRRRYEVLELAHRIYDESGFSIKRRDKERDARLAGAFRILLQRFNNAKASKGEADAAAWFTTRQDGKGNDVDAFLTHVSGMGIREKLDQANYHLRAMRQPLISDQSLAIIALSLAKSTHVKADGACPATSLLGMLRHFGLSGSGSTVRAAVGILSELGVIGIIRAAGKGICRAWKVLRRGFFHFLPPASETASSIDREGPSALGGKGPAASVPFLSVMDSDAHGRQVEGSEAGMSMAGGVHASFVAETAEEGRETARIKRRTAR